MVGSSFILSTLSAISINVVKMLSPCVDIEVKSVKHNIERNIMVDMSVRRDVFSIVRGSCLG